ncbi:hypothetical protein GCM10023196_053890 [Actinoallomurus vinaceus]|uniref:RNA polymerase sigma-70 region 4 domain-containing protein n=1 Tax=Actinoallomurus vinaceus TaxID=1080074 RepID=A0ABP8UFR4_9ACTN
MSRSSVSGDLAALTAAERRAKVVAFRRQRLSFAEIGRRLGVSPQRAHQLYTRALAEVPARHVDEHRAEELILIDDAIADLLDIAHDHTRPRPAVDAWNAIRGWAERKARLLGLDAPTRMQVITMDAIDAEIARLNAELAADDAAEIGSDPMEPRQIEQPHGEQRNSAAGSTLGERRNSATQGEHHDDAPDRER